MAANRTTETVASDEVLMARLQEGDDAALGELMARWELPVKAFLLRVGVANADVEDVAQETFVRLYQKRAAYQTGAAVKPWLLTLAANLGRSRMRWRWRRREDELSEEATGALASAEPNGAQSTVRNEVAAEVRRAVVSLPRRLREVVVAVEYEYLSHAEASQVLRCSPKAVETRLYRARSVLKKTLLGVVGDGSPPHQA